MSSRRILSVNTPARKLAVVGALGASMALLLGTASTASAAPEDNTVKVKPGEAHMGISDGLDKSTANAGSVTPADTSGVQGIDVSNWQGSINWNSVKGAGIDFAWMKATEGTNFKDKSFNTNYTASHSAGVIRGAYHFALPNNSNGATQANFFADSGGAWSADNLTLPGVLDIENNPYGAMCYGLSTSQMRTWINDFYNTYKSRTSRDVVIYTTANWWNTCTGNWTGMSAKAPLWVAHWTTGSPTIPAGFPTWTAWQYTDSGSVAGVSGNVDRNKFNGTRDRLVALANNT